MKHVMLLGCAALLGACSTAKVSQLESVPPSSIVDAETYQYKTKVVEEQIAEMPKWFKKLPESKDAIYSTGTAATSDLQLSVDLAVLNAKTTLADRINGRVRSQTKSFVAKIGNEDIGSSVLSEVEKATKNIIADVDVAGYKVQETEVVANGPDYRAYVLLVYSDKEANKIIMNRLRKDRMLLSKVRSTKAWEELEKTVDSVKEEDAIESENNMKVLTQ
ncbi:hypothetical protein MelnitzEXVC044M_76 [Methylophilales phage Melnitz EXVC044M]|nr:hypothetical protein Melnitz1EXVC043M_75 [Methylophilales phage Melnitz-1 EXVC043M]QZI94586.1 hypothetical protein Melnitz2EXVC040M_76 [Methylophilales phage Melnitz-2 EXVC040M]QZI94808.1 hypothetical protein MelnitzEXVC044M_76 [Methylophilales phage Melnitz EXVC044M]QZI95029.1 hypothetical protein Melnitz3EXVC039M_76 [Methylophilales phage Melnitz-3 EXVC039M]